jgi:hypothetical protein
MNVATTEPAQNGYPAAIGLPKPGSRVWVTGFPRHDHDEVTRLLGMHGLRASAFPNGTDAVLVPGPPSAETIADAAKAGRRVLVFDDLRSSLKTPPCRTTVEVSDDLVRVLDVELPRRPVGLDRVPVPEHFAHLCLDGHFLKAARSVAIAAAAKLPCALEGETAAAKSTAVLWVAWLCRQGAVRLNLNGQTDAGELVGRFLPNDLASDAASSSPQAAWRFWEGVVPNAMRHGYWVMIDEINLAEPQVLERLNPVLESPPSLVLAENRGERFGAGGDVPVADSFRMFATMNPAEYAGRSVLSPAFRDRWSLWNHVESPSQAEFRAMLDRLVYGTHPEFTLNGVRWQTPDSEPVYPRLGDEPGFDGLLDGMASFHAAVTTASGQGQAAELGRARRERYVFTRRTLLAAMRLVASVVERGNDGYRAVREALDLVYVQRVQPGPDREAVRSALRTVGLS